MGYFELEKLRKKTLIWLSLTLLFITLTFFSERVIKFYQEYQNLPPDHLIGNRPANVKALKEEGFPFSFLVVGDTQGSERAEVLIKEALKNGKFSFLIHLGDFVKKPDIWEHRFFVMEMIKEIRPYFPIFLVAGNHDIDYRTKIIKQKGQRVTQEIFDSLYGTRNFDFVFNNCLFILCEVDPVNPAGYLNYLRKILLENGVGKKYIFVFIHYPPGVVDKSLESYLPKEDEFFSLLETYKVTGCYFGHFHGYWRGERKGINLTVTGGGGRFKMRQPEWGRFHHILKVRVDEHMIDENLVVLKEGFGFEDRFERWVFTKIFPRLQSQSWVLYFTTAFFLSLGIFSFVIFILALRRKKKPLNHDVE